MAQLAGAHALSWAVGAYLPDLDDGADLDRRHDEVPRRLAAEEEGRRKEEESELSSGMLYSTGLVAGGSLGGVLPSRSWRDVLESPTLHRAR